MYTISMTAKVSSRAEKGIPPQDPSFFNLQKIAASTEHIPIQARLARRLIDTA